MGNTTRDSMPGVYPSGWWEWSGVWVSLIPSEETSQLYKWKCEKNTNGTTTTYEIWFYPTDPNDNTHGLLEGYIDSVKKGSAQTELGLSPIDNSLPKFEIQYNSIIHHHTSVLGEWEWRGLVFKPEIWGGGIAYFWKTDTNPPYLLVYNSYTGTIDFDKNDTRIQTFQVDTNLHPEKGDFIPAQTLTEEGVSYTAYHLPIPDETTPQEFETGWWEWNNSVLKPSSPEYDDGNIYYLWKSQSQVFKLYDYPFYYGSDGIVIAYRGDYNIGNGRVVGAILPTIDQIPPVELNLTVPDVGTTAIHHKTNIMGRWEWNGLVFLPTIVNELIYEWRTEDGAYFIRYDRASGVVVYGSGDTVISTLTSTTGIRPENGERVPSLTIEGQTANNTNIPYISSRIPLKDEDYEFVHFTCTSQNASKFPPEQGGDEDSEQTLSVTIDSNILPQRTGEQKYTLRIVDLMFVYEWAMTRYWILKRLNNPYHVPSFGQNYATELIVRCGWLSNFNTYKNAPKYSKLYPALVLPDSGLGIFECLDMMITMGIVRYSEGSRGEEGVCNFTNPDMPSKYITRDYATLWNYYFFEEVGQQAVDATIYDYIYAKRDSIYTAIQHFSTIPLLTTYDWQVIWYILTFCKYYCTHLQNEYYQVTTRGVRKGETYYEDDKLSCYYIWKSSNGDYDEHVTESSLYLNYNPDYTNGITDDQAKDLYSYSRAFSKSDIILYAAVLCDLKAKYSYTPQENDLIWVDKSTSGFVYLKLGSHIPYKQQSLSDKSAFELSISSFWDKVHALTGYNYQSFLSEAQSHSSNYYEYEESFRLEAVVAIIKPYHTDISDIQVPNPLE